MRNRSTQAVARPVIAFGAVAMLALGLFTAPMLNGAPRAALAADPSPTPNEHVISVSGTGKVTVKPDVADVSLGVTVQRDTAKAARDEAATAMNAVIAALKNLGVADKDIQTSNIGINPTYDYNSNAQRITGYQVTNLVSVHITEISKVADVIDDSVAAGATTVNGVTFDIADRATAENQARQDAVKDARAHADALASAAGVTINGVESISETTVNYPFPYYGVTADAAKGAPTASAPTPVQPGMQDITIMVTVNYLI
jgi:uncharacterized protein YggE